MAQIQKTRGFTLIELLIVVVIIGILAAFAIPRFMNQKSLNVQRTAVEVLKNIAEAEDGYYIKHGKYADIWEVVRAGGTFQELGITIPKDCPYVFMISRSPLSARYYITAEGNLDEDPIIDKWAIGPNGVPCHDPDDLES